MADRIDIVVTDGVDSKVEDKLTALATAARAADASVAKLQAQVAKGNTIYLQQETALNRAIIAEQKAVAATNAAAASQAQLNAATTRTTAAESQAAIAAARLATAQQQAAAAAAATAGAQVRAAQQAEASQQALQRAIERTAQVQAAGAAASILAQQRIATETQRTAAAQAAATAAAVRLGNAQAQGAAQATQAQQRLATAQQATAAAQQRATASTYAADAAYQRLQGSVFRASAAHASVTTAQNQAAASAQRVAAATSQAEAAASRAAAAALRLQNAQNRAASGGGGLISSLTQLGGTIIGVGLVYDALKSKFDETQAYINLENKLRLVAGSQERVGALTNDLLAAANRSRAPLEAFGTTFTRINNAIVQVGGSQKEAISITEALTKTIAVSGKSYAEQESALLQVSQAFNKGKLDGDEFRTVMEVLPEFADKLAKALGLANRGLLFSAAKEGKIKLDVMREAMRLMGDEADKNLAKSVGTVDQGFTRLKNSSIVLTGRLDEALGVSRALTAVLNLLADASERSAKAQGDSGPTNALATANATLANLDKQIAAQRQLITDRQAGVNGTNRLLRLEETRANVAKTIADLQAKQSDTASDDILIRKAQEQQAINAKNAAAQAEAAKAKEKEDKAESRRAASRRREFEEELQRLREKTAATEALTELEKVSAAIEAGKYKGVAKAGELEEIKQLAAKRDLENNRKKLDKEALEDSRALQAEREKSTTSINAENAALQTQIEALQQSAVAQQQVEQAKLDDLIASKEFQRDLLISITGINEQTQALDDQARALRQQKELKQQLRDEQFLKANTGQGGLFENSAVSQKSDAESMAEQNATIKRLLEERRIDEQTAANARLRINLTAQQKQLSFATGFFENLSQLQNSKSKKIAAIGKAAAIANTIIKTYESATSAYASLAGIPVIGPGLGAAAAAAAVAAGLANVQAIRAQGFRVGGYTGDAGVTTPVGIVHGKEFVVNELGTRNNRDALESLNRTGRFTGGGGMQLVVNNLGTPQTYEIQSITEERVQILARDIAEKTVRDKAPEVVAASLNEPNSTMSKSVSRNVDASRKR